MNSPLTAILTSQYVIFTRILIKMAVGDYNCYYYLDRDKGTGAYCRLCLNLKMKPCSIYLSDAADLLNIVSQDLPSNDLLSHHNHDCLTQFILYPTSLHLPLDICVSPDHPVLPRVLQACRRFCYSLHKDRPRKFKTIRHIVTHF